MAKDNSCCDPIILPPCSTRCQQLINSCCVINEANLPCLYPPIVVNGTTVIGISQIFVSTITGIEIGMTVFIDGESTNQVVTGVVEPNLVYVDTINSIHIEDSSITFKFVEQRQCDINEAIDAKLCACPTWTSVSPNIEDGWAPSGGGTQPPQYSNISGCTVRMRGEMAVADYITTGNGPIIGTLPATHWPAYNRYFVVVTVIDGQLSPSLLTVDATAGLLQLGNQSLVGGENVIVSFDGVFFEVAPN